MQNGKNTMGKSRLVLGTVQLGMAYGVNNTHGVPTKDEAFTILDAAHAGGINTFDTAQAYGTAEDRMGEWIAARSLAGKIFVVSKLKPNVLEEHTGSDVGDIVRTEIQESLMRLRLTHLDGYLLHTPQYLKDDNVLKALRTAKEEDLVHNIGVSIYDEADALHAVELGLDYVQVPYNAFDQRLDKTDFFERAKKNGVTVFARSPFLQGLLLMQPEKLPPHLSEARPHLEKFIEIAKRHGLSQLEAALIFVHHSRADHIVFGAETEEQLSQILGIMKDAASASELVKEIEDGFQGIDKSIVTPSLWNAKK